MTRPARLARKKSGWHPEEIKAAIRMRGSSMAELSRQYGYGVSAVRQVLRRPWPAVERIVAETIGVTPQEIWPDRYGEDGMPNRLLFGRDKFIPERTDCQRKKAVGE